MINIVHRQSKHIAIRQMAPPPSRQMILNKTFTKEFQNVFIFL